MRLHLVMALLLALLIPGSARAASPEREPIEVREFRDAHGHTGVLFSFPRRSRTPTQVPLTVDEARALLTVFQQVHRGRTPLPPVDLSAPPRVARVGARPFIVDLAQWQQSVHGDFAAPSGSGWDLPARSPFIRALCLSPKYMGEGVREAAVELFNSPAFIASLRLSVVLYLAALVAPEPFISKGAVAALTLYLMWSYGATEVLNAAGAVVRLYEEAQAARTSAELEEAARHFGVSLGGVGLRVGVVVALAEVAGKLPEVPRFLGGGGVWMRLGTPQGTLMHSVTWEGVPVVQATASGTAVVVGETATAEASLASGTFLLMGAVLGTELEAAASASKALRTTGGCREDNSQGDAPEHHIATNKNHTAEVRGGPWTPAFGDLFLKVGMDLDHPANKIFVVGHKGPHPEAYHRAIFLRLRTVVGKCTTAQQCKEQFIQALDELAADICKSGSELNKLVTRNP